MAHHQRVDAVATGEAERDRADDGARRRAGRADRREHRGDREHHPGDERDPTADHPHGAAHDEIDGPVVAGDGEQVGHADQGEDEVTADPADDLPLGQAECVHAHQPRGDETERPHVDRQQRAHHEQQDQRDDGYELRSHERSLRSRAGGRWMRHR
jgi:hypothetical protein